MIRLAVSMEHTKSRYTVQNSKFLIQNDVGKDLFEHTKRGNGLDVSTYLTQEASNKLASLHP